MRPNPDSYIMLKSLLPILYTKTKWLPIKNIQEVE